MSPKSTALLAIALAFTACAPEAVVVEEQPEPVKKTDPKPVEEQPLPDIGEPDDGLRIPEMLTLPGNADFRATSPNVASSGTGAVISRPPTDPPSRPKSGDE